MSFYNLLVIAAWLAFIGYWIISGAESKRNLRGGSFWRGAAIRVAIIIGVILVARTGILSTLEAYDLPSDPLIGGIGVLLCYVGVAYAIYARAYLGRNWGMPMSVKENPELVVAGPYAHVRHPIYSGVLLAILGSTLVSGLWWFVVFVGACMYFIYSAVEEEKLMQKEFPGQYPEYKKRTKMLVPFIF